MSKDKLIVVLVIAGLLSISFYSWYPKVEIKDVVRTSVLVTLCVFLFLGYKWSRWLLGILSAMGAVMSLLLVGSIQEPINHLIPLVLVGFFYFGAAFILLNPNMLKSHFSKANT